jgi:hypothetical protein
MSNRRTVAMVVNDNAGCLMPSGVSSSIASMLAPTGEHPKKAMVMTPSPFFIDLRLAGDLKIDRVHGSEAIELLGQPSGFENDIAHRCSSCLVMFTWLDNPHAAFAGLALTAAGARSERMAWQKF